MVYPWGCGVLILKYQYILARKKTKARLQGGPYNHTCKQWNYIHSLFMEFLYLLTFSIWTIILIIYSI